MAIGGVADEMEESSITAGGIAIQGDQGEAIIAWRHLSPHLTKALGRLYQKLSAPWRSRGPQPLGGLVM